MPADHQNAVRIAPPAAAGPLSRVRQQFNTLVTRLEKARVRLKLWHDEAPRLRATAETEMRPLLDAIDVLRDQQLLALDAAWADKRMGKREQEKLSDIICVIAMDVMDNGADDKIAARLYEKHTNLSFNTDNPDEWADMRAMFHAATGLTLDDYTDFSSPDTLQAAMRRKIEQAEQEAHAAAEEHAQTAKPSARAARHQAEENKLKQSVRDIFRKLASLLHPDRETDPSEHARKTALMQRANTAYAANDLLGLLELQLEVEQIDQTGLDNLGDDRIRQFNRVLERQIDEINVQIMAVQTAIADQMDWDFDQHRTPKAMLRQLRADVIDLTLEVDRLAGDLAVMQDIQAFKAWLKGYTVGSHDPDPGAPWS